MSDYKTISIKQIDSTAESIKNEETLVRLLCSPSYYDEKTGLVNPDAFDLRILPSGKPEEYVSLQRLKMCPSGDEMNQKFCHLGHIIWDEKGGNDCFWGYGDFNCGDAREVHEMVEINPLKGHDKSHIGLCYKHPKGGYYVGPLPKSENDNLLEILSDLADLLSVHSLT